METDDPWQDTPGWVYVSAWSDAAPDKGDSTTCSFLSSAGLTTPPLMVM
nr:MAG TPA: hypothetical protein [Caudoviricetes sp.]